jgi:hypothetical protein
MICAGRGPAFGPCGRSNATAVGRDGRGPGLNSLLAVDETSSSGPSAHQSSGVVNIRLLGAGA